MNTTFVDWYEKVCNELARAEDARKLQELINENKVSEPVLLLNPKHKGAIGSCGIKMTIMWTNLVPEDKAYMVNDNIIANNIRSVLNAPMM